MPSEDTMTNILKLYRSNLTRYLERSRTICTRLHARPIFDEHDLLLHCRPTSAVNTSKSCGLHAGVIHYINENAVVSVSFEEVQKLQNSGQILLIDVREPLELVEYGQYQDAINIPLGQLQDALTMSDVTFRQKFRTEKPMKSDSRLVFCCLAGVRSCKAVEIASSLGFSNVCHYKGGWEDYHKQMNLPFKKRS